LKSARAYIESRFWLTSVNSGTVQAGYMTYARAHLVNAENDGFYHCISRGVRRAWLCGSDPYTGQNFDHRRQWIEEQLFHLAKLFCIDVFGFAVMDNHYHLVVRIRPEQCQELTDEEVASRWVQIPGKRSRSKISEAKKNLLADEERLAKSRERLGSLSWFMRYVNEPIARRANEEDGCKGRFWEGRFKSYALLDETAVLAAMTYVDLNPWRANMVEEPEHAPHTSVGQRVKGNDENLGSLSELGLDLADYVQVLRWTALPTPSQGEFRTKVRYQHEQWCALVQANRHKFRAYGPLEKLKALAERLKQRWTKGYALRRIQQI
jgi:hypothetical protein